MNDVVPNEESVGPETSDDLQEISTEAVKASKKRRIRIALAAGVTLLLLVALLAITLGRDSGRSVTLVIVDKTSENSLPPDFSVSIASDAPQYPKMKEKRAEVDLGHVGRAGKPLEVTFETPDKSVVKFVFPKNLPDGDLVVLASLEDNEITARLGASKASAARKNPVAEARLYAKTEANRIIAVFAGSEQYKQLLSAEGAYNAIWGVNALAPWARIAQRIQDNVLPAFRAYAGLVRAQSSDSPAVSEFLSAEKECRNASVEKVYQEWVRASSGGDAGTYDQALEDMNSKCAASDALFKQVMGD